MANASDRTKEILSWYSSDNVGVKTNLFRLLNHGALAGTGKFLILPVDQGFEHGPARSFAPNPSAYDPDYHFRLAIDAGCNAYAAPLGFLEAAADRFVGQVPLILKLNNSDMLAKLDEPCSAVTSSVRDAVRLGCAAVGYTIYPGSGQRNAMYEALRDIVREAKDAGLPTVVWSYPRGGGLAKEAEQAVDVVAYSAHIACQLGAHIVKVKPPKDVIDGPEAKKTFATYQIPTGTLAERVRHVVQSCFNGRRIVIFSGGDTKDTADLVDDVRGIAAGGGFGSIVGRNSFQRPRAEALTLLSSIADIYRKAA